MKNRLINDWTSVARHTVFCKNNIFLLYYQLLCATINHH